MMGTTKEIAEQEALPKIRIRSNIPIIRFEALSIKSYFCSAEGLFNWCLGRDSEFPAICMKTKAIDYEERPAENTTNLTFGCTFHSFDDDKVIEMEFYYDHGYPNVMNFKPKRM